MGEACAVFSLIDEWGGDLVAVETPQLIEAPVPETLTRIQEALHEAARAITSFVSGNVNFDFKSHDDPVTEADYVVNSVLRDLLVRQGEGWLSEESAEDCDRLKKTRVWVVDPIDGTREFIAGIPEWCISIGLVENREAVAGGICNPATGETFIGSLKTGLNYQGHRAQCSLKRSVTGATILASRTEVKRGEWVPLQNSPFSLKPMGSVAYKLALVAAGLADATWTLSPKHEWDIAAGVALVQAAGGIARRLDGAALKFNNRPCLLPGLFASGPGLAADVASLLEAQRAGLGKGSRAKRC